MVNRFVEVFRYDKMVKNNTFRNTEIFLKLYNDLRKVMWCYVFLLLPLGVYSVRNYWREWKNAFASGEHTESQASEYRKMEEDEREVSREQGRSPAATKGSERGREQEREREKVRDSNPGEGTEVRIDVNNNEKVEIRDEQRRGGDEVVIK
jgi:hypothetical protein